MRQPWAKLVRSRALATTGSGKTTLARALADRFKVPHGEQNAWYHEAGWREASPECFRARMEALTAQGAWVLDGVYAQARDLAWTRADILVWLDYPAPLVSTHWRRKREMPHLLAPYPHHLGEEVLTLLYAKENFSRRGV